jgi:hypothetical protein
MLACAYSGLQSHWSGAAALTGQAGRGRDPCGGGTCCAGFARHNGVAACAVRRAPHRGT